jgi:hypothetical protein
MAPKSLATNIPKILANLQVAMPKALQGVQHSFDALDDACMAIDGYNGRLEHLREDTDKIYLILDSRKMVIECGLFTRYLTFYPGVDMEKEEYYELVQAAIDMKRLQLLQQPVAIQIPERFVPVQEFYQSTMEQVVIDRHYWALWVQSDDN